MNFPKSPVRTDQVHPDPASSRRDQEEPEPLIRIGVELLNIFFAKSGWGGAVQAEVVFVFVPERNKCSSKCDNTSSYPTDRVKQLRS